MPKCKINGKDLEVKEGTTIIEAFRMLDDRISHYCWHPGLSVAGVCRLCMVKIEGQNKLQIACNTVITDGMVISNQDQDVKNTVEWGLNFHLINHPLDCPICDQSGECGLQDQYMEFGKYKPSMSQPKVKKRKVIDLGKNVVLDSERCILCSRCVRFTEEVSKTNQLGIFKRGDQSEIGIFKDQPFDDNYSLNTVDICPVGALTSKDFRFRQRVWYLKKQETICPGCSTGCNVETFYNEEGLFRVRPIYNKDVNGHWMCDEGRGTYKFVNPQSRVKKAGKYQGSKKKEASSYDLIKEFSEGFKKTKSALVLTGQFTSEEYESLLGWFVEQKGSKEVYHWKNEPEKWDEFDGLLIRGDKNPNTFGLEEAMKKRKLKNKFSDLEKKLDSGEVENLIVLAPENKKVYKDLDKKAEIFSKAKNLLWLSSSFKKWPAQKNTVFEIPLKTFFEKEGTFKNHKGLSQKIKKGHAFVKGALTVTQVTSILSGKGVEESLSDEILNELKTNYFVHKKGVAL